jgi:hypothetical protein
MIFMADSPDSYNCIVVHRGYPGFNKLWLPTAMTTPPLNYLGGIDGGVKGLR